MENSISTESGENFDAQGQKIVNSEAVRARNARKRAKLKARARGLSPASRNFRLVAKTFMTYTAFPHTIGSMEAPFEDRQIGTETFSRSETYVSSTIWFTGHEVTDHCRVYLEVFFERIGNLHETELSWFGQGASRKTLAVDLYVGNGVEEEKTSWQDVTDVKAALADVTAAIQESSLDLS